MEEDALLQQALAMSMEVHLHSHMPEQQGSSACMQPSLLPTVSARHPWRMYCKADHTGPHQESDARWAAACWLALVL